MGSVLLEQRCADVCQRCPAPAFLTQLLGGRSLGVHTRFASSDASDASDADGIGDTAPAAAADTAGSSHGQQLNDSQRRALEQIVSRPVGEELTLLQASRGRTRAE